MLKMYSITCKKCQKQFETTHASRKYCKNPCTSKKSYAEMWLDRKDDKDKKKVNGDKIAYKNINNMFIPKGTKRICRG